MEKRYYEILGVNAGDDLKTIRQAYIKLQKKYHPDIYKGDKKFAENKISEINSAYTYICDNFSKINIQKTTAEQKQSSKVEEKQNPVKKQKTNKQKTNKQKEIYFIDLAILVNILLILAIVFILIL